jgi:hypothetical protein
MNDSQLLGGSDLDRAMSRRIICLLKGDLLDHAVAMQYWSEGFVLSSLASAALCSGRNRLVADLAALAVFHSQGTHSHISEAWARVR